MALDSPVAGGGAGLRRPTACTNGAASNDTAMLGSIYIAATEE